MNSDVLLALFFAAGATIYVWLNLKLRAKLMAIADLVDGTLKDFGLFKFSPYILGRYHERAVEIRRIPMGKSSGTTSILMAYKYPEQIAALNKDEFLDIAKQINSRLQLRSKITFGTFNWLTRGIDYSTVRSISSIELLPTILEHLEDMANELERIASAKLANRSARE